MMTAEQKVQWLIIIQYYEWDDKECPIVTDDNIDEIWEALMETDDYYDGINEARKGDVETDLECDYSRHFESKSVAALAPDGTWVGWTYWYGGGKHAHPEEIDWIDSAYDLDCEEEEKTVVVRTFTKK